MDTEKETIRNLFYTQIKDLTKKTVGNEEVLSSMRRLMDSGEIDLETYGKALRKSQEQHNSTEKPRINSKPTSVCISMHPRFQSTPTTKEILASQGIDHTNVY